MRALSKSYTLNLMTQCQPGKYKSSGSFCLAVVLINRQALCDIDVDDAKYPDDNAPSPAPKANLTTRPPVRPGEITQRAVADMAEPQPESKENSAEPRSKHATLATPAVRGLLK